MLAVLLVSNLLAIESRSSQALYEKVSPAVVGITCTRGSPNDFFGTGTIIDANGLVITSSTVVPKDATRIRVYLHGGEVLKGKAILTNEDKELSLFRIEAPQGHASFPFLKLGDSSDVRVGEPAFTLGNAFHSIEADDQVAFGEGVVSGLYDLVQTLSESKYSGHAIETTAHLNGGMDGGPLVDRNGALIGILCLNYSRSRWLGTAVPIDELKPLMGDEIGWFSDRIGSFPVYAGIEVELERGSELRIRKVHPDGPASKAGLTAGDRIIGAQGTPVRSVKELREALEKTRLGDPLRIEAKRGDEVRKVEIRTWGKF
jgi:serine protease Do